MIRAITRTEIDSLLPDARRSGLTFCAGTDLYGSFVADKLVSFGGVLWYSRKAVVKNLFVPSAERGKGYFKEILDFLLELIGTRGIKVIEATCTDLSLREFMKRGFVVVGRFRRYTKVRRENIS